jgi:hypothetical protein
VRFSRRGEEERDYFGVEEKGGKRDRGESGDAEKRFAFGVIIVPSCARFSFVSRLLRSGLSCFLKRAFFVCLMFC